MKNKCSCGKKANRYCPTLKSPICSLCCGTKRHEIIKCPDDCSYNPLNPDLYSSHYIALESKVQDRLIKMLKEWLTPSGFEKKKNRFVGSLQDEDGYYRRAEHFIFRLLTFEKDDKGRTFKDYLEASGYKGFSGLERIIAKSFVNSTGGIFEFSKLSENGKMIAEEVFLEEKFLFIDKSVAKTINRYDKVMLIYFELPTYARITGVSGVVIPPSVEKKFLSHVFMSYEEAVEKDLGLILGRYILENYLELECKMYDMIEDLQDRALSKLDFKECKAEFKLAVPREEIIAILDKKEDFIFEETERDIHYVWVRQGESRKYEDTHPTFFKSDTQDDAPGLLGRIILQDNRLILINFGKAQYNFCRKMLNRYFGNNIEFLEEIIVDQNKMLRDRERFSVTNEYLSSQKKAEEIPQEIKIQILDKFYRQNYEKFLNEPVPALSYKTPLLAAKDKRMKLALIELMKGHLNHIEKLNKKEGTNIQIDWVLDRLGLKGKI
ncbi:MAG TPA: hypothetical protein VM123_11795 [archaeon]|nr:hypothetical protein [archaeon]